MTDKIQKIREEVEKRFEQIKNSKRESDSGAFYQLKELLEFIDSMQEEPVSEDLEEEIKKYLHEVYDRDTTVGDVARHFAKWQKEQIEEALLSEVLPIFMHGGEADEVVAKLDEVLSQKK